MGKLSIYAENKWLDNVLKTAVFTPPADIYLSLHTADPTEDGSGAECADANNYSRTLISGAGVAFGTAAAARVISNDALITCPTASGSWGTVGWWGIWDSGTWGAGNLLAYGAFAVAKAVGSGQTPKVAIGEIDISVPTHTTYGMTTVCANEMLDTTFLDGDAGYVPANVYLALATGASNDAGSQTNESAGSNYARELINAEFDAAAASVTANTAAILHSVVANGAWGTISDYFIADAITVGNSLLYGTFNTPSAIIADDQFNIPIGDLDITMA